jgi:hypothetical protein
MQVRYRAALHPETMHYPNGQMPGKGIIFWFNMSAAIGISDS